VTVALLAPGQAVDVSADPEGPRLTGSDGARYLLFLVERFSDARHALSSHAAALTTPPRILVGPVEERRVIEF
jgi:hypothetical protein